VAPRDTTPEAVAPLLDRTLPGFGELFRMLSYEEVGAAAMLSRAVAGTAGRTALFVLPGSRKAVELAMDRLILPELGHIVGQLSR
jgi:molybdenum cofactor biosynthesis protein B